MPIVAPLEDAVPVGRIYRYTDKVYKLVKYTRRVSFSGCKRRSSEPKHTGKLAASVSRTRKVILEYALCNPWEHFCTFTISGEKYDRDDLKRWGDSFKQWIRDQRKRGLDIKFLLVPERHKDGAWHMHGFFSGVSSELVSFRSERKQGLKVPNKLANGDFYDWPAYRNKFGFCSFAPIRNPVASGFYVLKYLTKDMCTASLGVGLHLYYYSRGLNRSTVQADVYSWSSYLDGFLENDYKFCRTGMTKVKDGLDWSFGLEYVDFEPLFPSDQTADIEKSCDSFYEVTQLTFDDLSDRPAGCHI